VSWESSKVVVGRFFTPTRRLSRSLGVGAPRFRPARRLGGGAAFCVFGPPRCPFSARNACPQGVQRTTDSGACCFCNAGWTA
jgi:hypothetical protein